MASEDGPRAAKSSKEEFDIISNRISIALAARSNLIKSWTAASSSVHKQPRKTEAELDAEDAAHFRSEPAYLGVGAPIPSNFLVSDAERSNKSLRAKFFPGKGLKASKARDVEEKAASKKRGLGAGSSDEEEGRSGVGRAKKLKSTTQVKKVAEEEDTPKATKEQHKPQLNEEVEKVDVPENVSIPSALLICHLSRCCLSHSVLSHWQRLQTPHQSPQTQTQARTKKLKKWLKKQNPKSPDGLPLRQKSNGNKHKKKNKKHQPSAQNQSVKRDERRTS